MKDELGSGRCGGPAEGTGPVSAPGRFTEGAEAMTGKANEKDLGHEESTSLVQLCYLCTILR